MNQPPARHHIAVDIGASGGKMAAAAFDGERLSLEEYISIPNRPVQLGPALYWDIFSLYSSVLDGLGRYAAQGVRAQTLGVDTLGATYGFLDHRGRLLEPVFHYRDRRTDNVMEPLFENISQRELFALTGCQCNRTYTLPQLYAGMLEGGQSLQNADKMLFLPDLFGYFLCGQAACERTIAGTSALLNTAQRAWEPKVFERLGIPTHFLTSIAEPGTRKGTLHSALAESTGTGAAEVITTLGHDSAAAVAAIPDFGPGKLYISIGTNVSMGIEGPTPLLSDDAFEGGLKNTGGMADTIITYRDFPAFWIINGLRRAWRQEGRDYSFDELHELAVQAGAFHAFIDTEDPAFGAHDIDMPASISGYLQTTGQPVPDSVGTYVSSVFHSLALKIKSAAAVLERASGTALTEAVVINGGSRNEWLVQLICDALGLPVKAGMPYATLAGNLLCQLYATGEAETLGQMREISKNSFMLRQYTPLQGTDWNGHMQNMHGRGICR